MNAPMSQRAIVLACLDRPRRVAEVAAVIGRATAHAASLLAGLQKAGSVVRIRHGVYLRADVAMSTGVTHARSLQDAVMAACPTERSVEQLAEVLARSPKRLRTTLNRMVRMGLLEKVGRDGYRPPQEDLFSSSHRDRKTVAPIRHQ